MYIGFPDDYQTNFYLQRSVDDYGRLVTWNSPNADRSVVLIKVSVIHMHLIPKSIVIRQLGGDRACWTAAVFILRGTDWNAHDPDVPTADEEPPPANGVLPPMFGEGLMAEQLYQQQVHNWLVQNGAPPASNANQGNGPIQNNVGWGVWPAPPAPPLPALPPHLVNYQAWLAAQGLTVHHGIVPENNISDNPSEAWNDSIIVSDDSSSEASDELALVVIPHQPQ